MAELDVAKLHAAAVAAHAALEEALGLEDEDQRRADAKAAKLANSRVAKMDRSVFRVPGSITSINVGEMEWDDGVLPAETYKVGDDRMISVHPAHEELVRMHGAKRDRKANAESDAEDAEDAKAEAAAEKKATAADRKAAREEAAMHSGDMPDAPGMGRENVQSEVDAAKVRTHAAEHETKAQRAARDAETTSGPFGGQPGTQYAGSPELAGGPLSAREYGREPEATE